MSFMCDVCRDRSRKKATRGERGRREEREEDVRRENHNPEGDLIRKESI